MTKRSIIIASILLLILLIAIGISIALGNTPAKHSSSVLDKTEYRTLALNEVSLVHVRLADQLQAEPLVDNALLTALVGKTKTLLAAPADKSLQRLDLNKGLKKVVALRTLHANLSVLDLTA